eukprot:c52826_g1_i1 orf=1-156(-)
MPWNGFSRNLHPTASHCPACNDFTFVSEFGNGWHSLNRTIQAIQEQLNRRCR